MAATDPAPQRAPDAAAPGAKELVSIGKLIDLSQRTSHADAPEPYDLVIVDAPSTWHALAMLAAPRGVAELAPVGPIARQARKLRDFLADPDSKQLRALAEGATRAGLLRAVLAQHRRARVHAARVEWLRERTPAPIVTLPFMFQSEIGQREYAQFGRELCDRS